MFILILTYVLANGATGSYQQNFVSYSVCMSKALNFSSQIAEAGGRVRTSDCVKEDD